MRRRAKSDEHESVDLGFACDISDVLDRSMESLLKSDSLRMRNLGPGSLEFFDRREIGGFVHEDIGPARKAFERLATPSASRDHGAALAC